MHVKISNLKLIHFVFFIIFINLQIGIADVFCGIIQGTVFDKDTGKPIENANVIILNTKYGSATNHNGFFIIKTPANQYEIEARMMGYKIARQTGVVTEQQELVLNFHLEAKVYQMPAVQIISDKFKSKHEISILPIQPHELKKVPALAEPDILRAVSILPGVTSINDFSSQFFVRGGNFDQTMIFFDGAPVYNPYHLGGIFSMFYSEALGEVTLHAGGYPVQDDGYLSGILNIHTKDYNNAKKATMSIASSGLIFENKLLGGTCLLSLRRTYLDIFSLMLGEKWSYYFYDVIAKYTIDINSNNRLHLSTFYSKDHLGTLPEEEFDRPHSEAPNWGNKVLTGKWNSILNPNLYLESLITYSESFMKARTLNNDVNNTLTDLTFKENLYINWGVNHLLLGGSLKKFNFNYEWDIRESALSDIVKPVADVFFDYAPRIFKFQKSCYQAGIYFQNEVNLSDILTATCGLRWNRFSANPHTGFAPRVSISYEFDHRTKMSMTYGKFHQYLYTLKEQKNQSLFTPFTAILPIDSGQQIRPATSDHYIVGLEIKNLCWNLDVTLENYYKKYKNLITSLDDIPRYQHEDGFAYGCDLLIKKDAGKFRGWMSYAFGVSKKVSRDFTYYTNYDRTHTVKTLGYFQLTQKWKLNFYWIYASGTCYTPLIGKFQGGCDWREDRGEPEVLIGDFRISDSFMTRQLYGTKNSLRLPAYHRLDLGVSRNFYIKNHVLSVNFQVLNVYLNDNPFYYDYSVNRNSYHPKQSNGLPILPTMAIEMEF